VLLTRADALLPSGEQDVMIDIDLSRALFFRGRLDEAEASLENAIARATERGDERSALVARLRLAQMTMHADPEGREAETLALATSAMATFEAAGDDRGLIEAWTAIAYVEHNRCHFAARKEALEQAIHHAERLGDERWARQLERQLAPGYLFGPTPVDEALRWFEAADEARAAEPFHLSGFAVVQAMRGRIEEARALEAEAVRRSEAFGSAVTMALVGAGSSDVEMRAGNPAGAEAALRRAFALLEETGERGWLSSIGAELGLVLCVLGRYDEAEELAVRSRELGGSDDVLTQLYCLQVQARVDAQRGKLDEAERLAREAVEIGESTDMLVDRGGARLDLAAVLALAGRRDEALAEVDKAIELFERKCDRPNVERALERRAQLA
jgi:tetratricopeptide (TPR) repeat protein